MYLAAEQPSKKKEKQGPPEAKISLKNDIYIHSKVCTHLNFQIYKLVGSEATVLPFHLGQVESMNHRSIFNKPRVKGNTHT